MIGFGLAGYGLIGLGSFNLGKKFTGWYNSDLNSGGLGVFGFWE